MNTFAMTEEYNSNLSTYKVFIDKHGNIRFRLFYDGFSVLTIDIFDLIFDQEWNGLV